MIFEAISFFNHSCVPNVINFFWNNVMICITSQNIENGSELFISYLDGRYDNKSLSERRLELEQNYGFKCNCEKCKWEESANLNEKDIKDKKINLKKKACKKSFYDIENSDFILKKQAYESETGVLVQKYRDLWFEAYDRISRSHRS